MERKYFLSYSLDTKSFEHYPIPWKTIFRCEAPLAVEIGFGNGEFLVDWAHKQPDLNIIGIEISMESIERACKRIDTHQLANVMSIHEDARFAIREFFNDNSISHVMMNFPDPWPKDRHKKRRLLDENFTDILAMTLQKNGKYELVTDQDWYAQHAYDLFAASSAFKVRDIEINPSRDVTTKYERKWQEMGRQSYRVIAEKIEDRKVKRLLENTEMPHAFVEKPVDTKRLCELIGYIHQDDQTLFTIKSVYLNAADEQFLLKVVAKDQDYQQNILVGIYRHNNGKWIVKLDPAVQPYRTPAVKQAVWQIGDLLNK
jgi:tRNA (guanine-N7-)-methyltransferase